MSSALPSHLSDELEGTGNAMSEKERNKSLTTFARTTLFPKVPFVTPGMLAGNMRVAKKCRKNVLPNMNANEFAAYWEKSGQKVVRKGINAKRNNVQNEMKKTFTKGE
jgi:hypothetical protein